MCGGGGLGARVPTCVTFHHMRRDAWLAPLGNFRGSTKDERVHAWVNLNSCSRDAVSMHAAFSLDEYHDATSPQG